MIKENYDYRLSQFMKEADVFDDRGNVIISKDLKVKHKDSQYEYTVDDIMIDPDSNDVKIALRLPDEPRLEPPASQDLISDTGATVIEEDELRQSETYMDDDDEFNDVEIFIVNQKEFEDEYEVK